VYDGEVGDGSRVPARHQYREMPGVGQGAGELDLSAIAEDDVRGAARGFHFAVQIVPRRRGRRRSPRDFAQEQRAFLS